jgi:hypothetical protein
MSLLLKVQAHVFTSLASNSDFKNDNQPTSVHYTNKAIVMKKGYILSIQHNG